MGTTHMSGAGNHRGRKYNTNRHIRLDTDKIKQDMTKCIQTEHHTEVQIVTSTLIVK